MSNNSKQGTLASAPRILYVDDEEDLVLLAQSFFEEEGMKIEVCTDFVQALEKIRKNDYDIVITDSNMPRGSGTELAHVARSEGVFQGKLVLVTGNIEYSDVTTKHGFDLVIYKPVNFQELIDQVRQLLTPII